MKDKSLDGQTTQEMPAPAAPVAPAGDKPEETLPPAINSVQAMLEGRFADIEKAIAPKQDPDPEPGSDPEPEEEPAPETTESTEEPTPEEQEVEDAVEEAEETEEPIEGLDKLTPELQERVNKRIGKLTARAKSAEERIEALKQENLELQAKVKNGGLSFDEAMAVTRAGLPPEYLSADESKVIHEEEFYRSEADWAWDNMDGAVIDGKEYDARQMREYYRKVKAKHEELQPKARTLITERLTQYQEDLKQARAIRAKLAKVQGAKPPEKKPAGAAKPPPPVPPASATRKPPVSASRPGRATFDAQTLMSEGVTRQSLQAAMERSFGG